MIEKMEQPNLSYIQSMSAEDKEFEHNLIQIIKREFEEEKVIYLKNIKAKNYTRTAENVHKIKHKIGILGLEKGYKVAVEFEENLREGKIEVKEKFEAVLNIMTNFIEQL